MIVLGIAGSPAGGKSTIARWLEEQGATWIDADRIAHQVLDRPEIVAQLVARFGSEIADSEGRIERSRLAPLVFGDDDARRAALIYLESVIHPETRRVMIERMKEAWDQGTVAVILDVPLLFESNWDLCCDEIWCVDAPRADRLRRVAARGWSDDELRRRESNQRSMAEKNRRSNFLIHNDGSTLQLTETINKRWSSLIRRQNELPTRNHCLFGQRTPPH